MDYLVKMLTRQESFSPLAPETGDRRNKQNLVEHNQHHARATNARSRRKVNANIDGRFKAVSDDRRPTSTSRIDPWVSNYVLVFLKSRSTISNFHPKEAPMIEILNRGGSFWDYNRHLDTDPKDLEGWMLVSDGLHSIKVWLTKQCRDEIWQEVTTSMATPMYAFHNYSARQCGLLEKFCVKPIQAGTGHLTPACELLCDSFRYQPQMQYMVVADPYKIQNVNDYVEVKHAFQAFCKFQSSGVRLGNIKDVVDNPELCRAILEAAEREQQQQQAKERANQNRSAPAAAAAAVRNESYRQGKDNKSKDDKGDDDGVPSMNIRDMLASPNQAHEDPPRSSSTSLQPPAKRDLTGAMMETLDNPKKNEEEDDETDFMGSLPNSALLELDSQPVHHPPAMETNKESERRSQDVIEMIETRRTIPNATIRSSSHRKNGRSMLSVRNHRPKKRIKFREKDDWPNLPAFTAFCKQLNDPSRKVIDIPEIQQPRVSLKNEGFRQWLSNLGY